MSAFRHGALPKALSRLHPTRRTPTVATIVVGIAAAVMLLLLTVVSPDFIGDALLSIGLMICAYYSATGLACVHYFRHACPARPATSSCGVCYPCSAH